MNEDEKILNEYGANPCIYNDGGILVGSKELGILRCNKCHSKFTKENLDIFWKLLACGAGEETTQKVISDEKLFQQYKDMKYKGVSDLEVALILRENLKI